MKNCNNIQQHGLMYLLILLVFSLVVTCLQAETGDVSVSVASFGSHSPRDHIKNHCIGPLDKTQVITFTGGSKTFKMVVYKLNELYYFTADDKSDLRVAVTGIAGEGQYQYNADGRHKVYGWQLMSPGECTIVNRLDDGTFEQDTIHFAQDKVDFARGGWPYAVSCRSTADGDAQVINEGEGGASGATLDTREVTVADAAQMQCYNKADGDFKLHLEVDNGSFEMYTFVHADDFLWDLSPPKSQLYCNWQGKCQPCSQKVSAVQISDAPFSTWCYFTFTDTISGNHLESFYVFEGQGRVQLHNAGYIHNLFCHTDATKSQMIHEVSARAEDDLVIAQAGCAGDINSYRLEFGMGQTTFQSYIPNDGVSRRLGQPSPEVVCSSFGQCKDCTDKTDCVYFRSGPATSHCEMLFTESLNGGDIFSIKITREQYIVQLPKPGVLAFAVCYKPGEGPKSFITNLRAAEGSLLSVHGQLVDNDDNDLVRNENPLVMAYAEKTSRGTQIGIMALGICGAAMLMVLNLLA